MMKNRRKHDIVSWSRFFWCTLFVVVSFFFFSGFFFFSTFRVFFGETFHPVLGSTWLTPVVNAVSDDSPTTSAISIRETVMLPDQTLIFLKYPPSDRLFTKEELHCVYSANSSQTQLKEPPSRVENEDLDEQIVRCPPPPRGYTVSLLLKSAAHIQGGPTRRWDSLVYEALIDRDDTTIVFVKGLNLRPQRVAKSSMFECVYGWDFRRPKFMLRSEVLSIAQEIVRCRTPLSILSGPQGVNNDSVKVSIRVKGRGTLHSIARPIHRVGYNPPLRKQHEMCFCTMVRNGAKSLREWVMYHAQIGVQRWFIYDNNSDDNINEVIEELINLNYSITRHIWPWIKTQEAGFAHCAITAQEECNWIGFIDVDEFLHLSSKLTLQDVIKIYTKSRDNIGELRTSCYSFGPSGLKNLPPHGMMVGYTCRLTASERHKSIVKPEALNSTLINVVHHFHLRDGFVAANVDKGLMVINHYKYQVWEVFKEKFYRRVATYVADWQKEQHVGSKDRAPGLGTRPVEPPDWSSRFCEVRDTELRDRVLEMFANSTHRLPWQEGDEQVDFSLNERRRKKRRKRKHRGWL